MFTTERTLMATREGFRFGPCVDGSGLARRIFTTAGLVGAAMCSASHDGFSVKGREGQQNVIQGGALIPAGFPAKPHIRWELIPSHCPAFGTGELQENGTTLCRRRRSATPNNGDVPSDHRLLGTRIASRIGDWSGSRLQDCTSRYDAVGDEPP